MDSICMPTGCEDIFAEEDSGPAWPQWLEAFRVPDEPRAAAYEDTPAHLRAAIKAALALHQAHAGEMDSRTCRDERFPRRGFRRTATDGPAPFALAAFARPSGGGPHARHPGRCPADRGFLSWR